MEEVPEWYAEPWELEGREFKREAPWDAIKHRLMRTAIAMSNREGGGTIVVGGKESNSTKKREIQLTGVSAENLRAYTDDREKVLGALDQCAYPPLETDMNTYRAADGKTFVVFRVLGLRGLPHVSIRRELPDRLGIEKGVVYARIGGNKPSSEAADGAMLRDLWQLAEFSVAGTLVRKMIEARCPAFAPGTAAAELVDGTGFGKEMDF